MAGKNRTSYKSQVNTDLPSASTITAAEMRAHLQDELSDNIIFRLDVIDTQDKTSGAFSIDFADVDQIITTITGTAGSTVTISNLEDGDVKYWVVNKSATETISFAAATDISPVQDYITAATKVVYRIISKNTSVYVESLLNNLQQATTSIKGILETATQAEASLLSNTTNALTPGVLEAAVVSAVAADPQNIRDETISTHEIGGATTYSVVSNIQTVLVDATSGSVYINLPADSDTGRKITVWASIGCANNITVRDSGGNTVATIAPGYAKHFWKTSTFSPLNYANNWAYTESVQWDGTPACPYIYINNIYFDEILKNQIGQENNKEEILNISNNLNIGKNIIKFSEEKDETTYLDYLKVKINGVETFLIKDIVIYKCNFYEFEIVKENQNDIIELIGKGYYIRN